MRICPRCQARYPTGDNFCTVDARPLVDEAELRRVGRSVGNYQLTEILGRGGMGTVYRGRHLYIGKDVAVKILHDKYSRFEDAVKRFLREARAASSIHHANIVAVTDFGETQDGGVYFVMEYVEGEPLEDTIEREAPMPLHRAIGIVDQLASALAAAHAKGIIHRDLKPDNVMRETRPGRRELLRRSPRGLEVDFEEHWDFVKILDFGIAKVLEPHTLSENAPGTTAAGAIIGTPEYMSVEAARGVGVDHRADIYSLGVLFYDLLVGQPPFHGGSAADVVARHISEDPLPPRRAAPKNEISEGAEALILRALAKDPDERQQSMDELRDELRGCFGSLSFRRDADWVPGAREAGIWPRTRRLTEELDEWLHQERRRQAPADGLVGGSDEAPLLLTKRKRT